MDFLLLYMAAMTIPGMLLSQMFNLDVCRGAVGIALSFSLLTLLYVLAGTAGLQVGGFGYLLIAGYLAILAAAVLRRRDREAWLSLSFRFDRVHLIPAVTMGSVLLYMVWAGPYVEVPSDAWRHIDELSAQISETADGKIGSIASVKQFFSGTTTAWYAIHAYFLNLTQTSLEAGLDYIAIANTLLFCTGIYSFALFIFRPMGVSRTMLHFMASASVFFFMTHFGISVFSYVRYYVYGATIVTFVVYLGAIACFLRFITGMNESFRFLAAFGFMGLIAATAHKQEAMFIVVMACGILAVEFLREYAGAGGRTTSTRGPEDQRRRKYLLLMTGAVVVLYLLAHVWAHLTMGQEHPLQHGRLADIQKYLPFLRNMYVLRPEYQFYQVITVWGAFVYLLFLVRAKRFLTEPYFVAGMAVPVVTVFNPVFTDLFLHVSPPTVLYRMCYLLPLPFLGAFFLVKGVKAGVNAPGWQKKLSGIVVAALLLGLLLPVNSTYFVAPYSKIYTLAPVDERNDHRMWSDLIEFLRTREKALVVTDSVTGYVVDGMTHHRYPGVKFYVKNWRKWLRVNGRPGSYDFEDFRDKNGAMVIVNKRDGALSATARHGRHWPEDIMKVSKQYSNAFLNYVNSHPAVFEEIWRHDGIVVYQVNTDGYKAE